jgi:DNA-directed RNA polymerase subunit RPC12/RpoP
VTSRWHVEPKDECWREVHLAHVESLGNRLWLRCNVCGHSLTPQPRAFAAEHHLDMQTPLLLIARRLKCTHCNERKAHCWPEPYGIKLMG